MKNTQKTGKTGESYAAQYLNANNYKIIETNYHSRFGEIDIIAHKSNKLYLIEVKTRTQKNSKFDHPEYSITNQKLRKIQLTYQNYLYKNRNLSHKSNIQFQIDVIIIFLNSFDQVTDLRHYRNVS